MIMNYTCSSEAAAVAAERAAEAVVAVAEVEGEARVVPQALQALAPAQHLRSRSRAQQPMPPRTLLLRALQEAALSLEAEEVAMPMRVVEGPSAVAALAMLVAHVAEVSRRKLRQRRQLQHQRARRRRGARQLQSRLQRLRLLPTTVRRAARARATQCQSSLHD